MKTINVMIALLILLISSTGIAQTIKRDVIGASGKVMTNGTTRLSFTTGEVMTKKVSASGLTIHEGFQQNLLLRISIKAFLQGYYTTAGSMQNVLYNQGITALPGNECDSLIIQLRGSVAPYTVVYQTKEIIQTNGMIDVKPTVQAGQSYYIVLKGRNILETWSASPVTLASVTNYDFTTSANKAYANKQVQMAPSVWAIYSGDLNNDENIDLLDATMQEADIENFVFGYFATDINGDGNVDLLDQPTLETNINDFVFAEHP